MKYRLQRDLWVRIEKIETGTSGYWFVPNGSYYNLFSFDEYIRNANNQSDKYEGKYEILYEFDSWEEAILQVPWMFL